MARPRVILLVEDNPGDVELTRTALEDSRLDTTLHAVRDGDAALRFLRREGGFGDAPRPDLVLLDLNIPKKSGKQILSEVKQDPTLRTIPVIVLTSSDDSTDVSESYHLYANGFVKKPIDLAEFLAAVRGVADFWLRVVTLPHRVPVA